MKNKTLLIATSIVLGLVYFYVNNDVIKKIDVISCYILYLALTIILLFNPEEKENTLDDFLLLFCMQSFIGGICIHTIGFWTINPSFPEFTISLGVSFFASAVIAMSCWYAQQRELTAKNKEGDKK